ncbi:MAG: hypothetical protein HY675_02155 [Chloroflexi bacterium]|nr:hypothetical protein [Chloroflexota bacterium]
MQDQESFCWEIKRCDEHQRRGCPAYKLRKNCWDVAGTPINGDDHLVCESCPVILTRLARAIAEAMGQTRRTVRR